MASSFAGIGCTHTHTLHLVYTHMGLFHILIQFTHHRACTRTTRTHTHFTAHTHTHTHGPHTTHTPHTGSAGFWTGPRFYFATAFWLPDIYHTHTPHTHTTQFCAITLHTHTTFYTTPVVPTHTLRSLRFVVGLHVTYTPDCRLRLHAHFAHRTHAPLFIRFTLHARYGFYPTAVLATRVLGLVWITYHLRLV